MLVFLKCLIPMIRRTFPELITNEIVGVQPMSGPVGLAFALRYAYQSDFNWEVWYSTEARTATGTTGPGSPSAPDLGKNTNPNYDGSTSADDARSE